MELEVSGTKYSRFTEATATISLDSLASSFSFSAVSVDGKPLPFKGGEPCKVIVDGDAVLSGFIEVVAVSYNSDSHNIRIVGRSATADLVDSSLDAKDYTAPITLIKVIEDVIDILGLDIGVIDNTDIEPFNDAEDKISSAVGENAFSFIERLARKRQVLLTQDSDSNVVITRSEPDAIEANLINRAQPEGFLSLQGQDSNNIMSAQVRYDHTKRFRKYSVKSSINTSFGFSGNTDLKDIVDQKNTVDDTDVREGRQLIIVAEKSSSNEQCKERATWEANIRKTRSQVYKAVVQGYRSQAGVLWSVNKLVTIVDDFSDINANMLINSVKFMFSISGGSTTELGFVDKDAYKVIISEPDDTGNLGGNLFQ